MATKQKSSERGRVTEMQADANELTAWQKAQLAERQQHTLGYAEGLVKYAHTYQQYFSYVGLGKDLHGLNVIEIGPADFPALAYCHNWSQAWTIEPMPSEHLTKICTEKRIGLLVRPFEDFSDFEKVPDHKTEVWLFNVLQHVERPHAVVEKAKVIADRIRFFEPINEPVTEYHLNTFSLQDYTNWFYEGPNDTVNLYAGGTVPNFHTADCTYGIWHRQ